MMLAEVFFDKVTVLYDFFLEGQKKTLNKRTIQL